MAKLEDLKETWQSQSGISKERFDEIGAKVRDSTNLLQKVVFRRDMVETAASGLVVAFASVFLFKAKNWVDWSGYLIVLIGGIAIPIVLWWARRRSLATVSAVNFRDFVDIEIDYLRRQNLVLRMIALWYILPIYVGVVLVMIGLTDPRRWSPETVVLAACLSVVGGFCVFVWWLNQHARKSHLEPLLNYYVEMKTALENGDESIGQLPGPPSDFLQPQPRKPISKRKRWIWIAITVVITALAAGAGVAIMHYFNARTGKFIISTAPVLGVLMIVISGIWRRNPELDGGS